MIEVYSKNISVDQSTPIPLNNTALLKGTSVTRSGVATLVFNDCGIYQLTCNANVTTPEGASGNIDAVIQLEKNDVLQPQAISSATIEEGDTASMTFTTLVQVPRNNCECPCCSPTVCDIENVGAAAQFTLVDIVVTKLV